MEKIIGKSIELRKYRLSDAIELHKWRNDKDTTKWMGRKFRDSISLEFIKKGLNEIISSESENSLFYVISEKKQGSI